MEERRARERNSPSCVDLCASEDVPESQIVDVGDVGLGSGGPRKTQSLFVSSDCKVAEKRGQGEGHELGNCLDIPFEGESITALVLASAKLTVEDVGSHEHDVKGGARLHRCRVEGLQNGQGRVRVNERVRRRKPERNMDAQTR